MKPRFSADRWLALFFLAFAALLVFVWAPLDTSTGVVEEVRRRLVIGDALGPSVAGAVIAFGAVLLLMRSGQESGLTSNNVRWLIALTCLLIASLMLMRYAGPIAALWTESGYRPLRNTRPWNYIGFLMGGTVLIAGLTAFAQRKATIKDIAIGFAASLAIALLYDVPFEDLILPPNGDV